MKLSLALSAERIERKVPGDIFGVGMIRGEYIFRRLRAYVTTIQARDALFAYLAHVCKLYVGEPVWYRCSELDVEEVKVLAGCDDFEANDRILSMGMRGVRRAIAHPAAFALELEVVAQVSASHPNLGIVFPFVAEPSEAKWAADMARNAGFRGPLSTMVEIPAAAVTLDVILSHGFVRALFGLNDGTAFTMGAYRGSERYPGLPLGVARMIEIARAATERANAELALAGGVTQAHLDAAVALGVDTCVLHYADLPKLLGPAYNDLPDLDAVTEVKRWTRAAIKARRSSLNIVPTDPYGN